LRTKINKVSSQLQSREGNRDQKGVGSETNPGIQKRIEKEDDKNKSRKGPNPSQKEHERILSARSRRNERKEIKSCLPGAQQKFADRNQTETIKSASTSKEPSSSTRVKEEDFFCRTQSGTRGINVSPHRSNRGSPYPNPPRAPPLAGDALADGVGSVRVLVDGWPGGVLPTCINARFLVVHCCSLMAASSSRRRHAGERYWEHEVAHRRPGGDLPAGVDARFRRRSDEADGEGEAEGARGK
jgi:hypothetical protein